MVGLDAVPVLALTSMLIGVLALFWEKSNSAKLIGPSEELMIDKMHSIQDQLSNLNFDISQQFSSVFAFVRQEACFEKMKSNVSQILFSFK